MSLAGGSPIRERVVMDKSETEHGVSDTERSILNELTGPGKREGAGTDSPGFTGERAEEPPRTGPLTEAELAVRRELLKESGRIVREALPGIFARRERERRGIAHDQPTFEAERDADSGRRSRTGALIMEILGLPERRLGPTVVMGLGLAGVLLLMALLAAILIQAMMRQ